MGAAYYEVASYHSMANAYVYIAPLTSHRLDDTGEAVGVSRNRKVHLIQSVTASGNLAPEKLTKLNTW